MFKNSYSTAPVSTVWYVREGEDDAAAAAEAAMQAKIDAAVLDAVKGLKTKNDELIGREKKLKESLAKFDGVDFEKLKELQGKLDNDEDAKLFAEGKKNVVIDKYTERMRNEHTTQIEAERAKIAAAEERASKYRGAVLDNHIRAVCSGLHKGAVDDALLNARNTFVLDDNGNAVQLDSSGSPVLGKDGKTPFSPAEWIEQMKELKPHWFPSGTSGSGSGNAGQGAGSGKTMKRSDFDRLSPYEQAKAATSGVKITD